MIDYDMLIDAFEDTLAAIDQDTWLQEASLRMQAATRLYPEGFYAYERPEPISDSPVIVEENTTFRAAAKYMSEGKTAVLNFANPHEPGGGVRRGSTAQEECLCRSSNLYMGLDTPYLMQNYYQWHLNYTDSFFSDQVIYSPGVTVFKSDHLCPMRLEEPFQVDVLTCAAPFCPELTKREIEERLPDVMRGRIRNVLEVAIANKVEVLVLGAFGCGAFSNPRRVVAEQFRSVLMDEGYRGYFKRVVFAIKRSKKYCPNLKAFHEAFSK